MSEVFQVMSQTYGMPSKRKLLPPGLAISTRRTGDDL